MPVHHDRKTGTLDMKRYWRALKRLCRKTALTPQQAEQLAQIKFPCC